MTNRHRTVAGRQKSLQPAPPEADSSLAGVGMMYERMGGREIRCTISEYCRTQVFEFPGITFRPEGEVPHLPVYSSASVRACVTSDLVDYFERATSSKHYAIAPSLRHVIAETDEKVKTQQKNSVPVFIVVEEVEQLTPVAMVKGECRILDEIIVVDGEEIPMLIGGRLGEKYITASHTLEGAWPKLPDNQQSVNLVLAGVRAGQQTPDPIRKYADLDCLVTDDGWFVTMSGLTGSARVSIVKDMYTAELKGRVFEIASAISAMEQDIGAPHLALLVDSMYSDEHKDDPYKRLQYLRLWESLVEAGRKPLSYQGNIRDDKVVVAGKYTLEELKEYRHDIAHWWTDTIDENYLTDLQRTINELMRRKYF